MKKLLLSGILTAMILSIYSQVQVGRTQYDLQTNNSGCRRITTDPTGDKITITYTRSHTSGSFSDRGTGYNYSNNGGSSWTVNDYTGSFDRVDTTRTGWPNIVYTSTKEVIVSHITDDFDGLQVLRRDIGSSDEWVTSILSGSNATVSANASFANDATWSRTATSGDSIVAIFGLFDLDLPGMDGGLLMYRSTDAGQTWIGPDLIDELSSSNFTRVGGDSYALDFNNGKISIVLGIFQVEVLTSTDWGATFTKTSITEVRDEAGILNPLFSASTGETMLEMNISDGSYSLFIDDQGVTHVFFGRVRGLKDDIGASGYSWFPQETGLIYWNSSIGEANVIHHSELAAQQPELNFPVLFTSINDQPDAYNEHFSSMASAGFTDDDGTIYVAYSSIKPATFDDVDDINSVNNVDDANLFFRDIYLLKSSNGIDWEGPINVSDQPLREAVYPSVPRKLYGTSPMIPVMWQEDDLIGINLQGISHDVTENKIMFNNIALSSIVTPTDITAPTISENVIDVSSVTAYANCDIDFSVTFGNHDVPDGIDVLDYLIVDATGITTPGIHNIEIYVVDAANNSSDTVQCELTVEIDITVPTAALIGPAIIDVLINTPFVDPGLTYSDNACMPALLPDTTDNVNDAFGIASTTGTFDYEYLVTDNSGNTTTVTRTVNVVGSDIVPPVITLNGVAMETIEACSNWIDAGLSAFDNIDYDITNAIVATGSINTGVPGIDTITYIVDDAAFNSDTAYRIVTIVDTQEPDLTVDQDGTLYWCQGTSFIVPGSTSDDCVTNEPTITTTADLIDVNSLGLQHVVYTATDEAGNDATKTIDVEIGIPPVSSFTLTQTGSIVSLTDASTNNPNYWKWDFGDNKFKTAQNALHSYTSAGTYEICLITRNNFNVACNVVESKSCQEVSITVGIAEFNKLNTSVNIFPNPTSGKVNISIDENLTNVNISIYNVVGEIVATRTIANTAKTNNVNFDLGNNATGIYIVNISTENATTSKKVVLK